MIDLYDYCVEVLHKAQAQGIPEFALNKHQANCLRYVKSAHANFTFSSEGAVVQ